MYRKKIGKYKTYGKTTIENEKRKKRNVKKDAN